MIRYADNRGADGELDSGALDKDVNNGNVSIRGLRRDWKYNTTAPILKLPPEVLVLVFELATIPLNSDHPNQDPNRSYQYQQLRLSHTCSRWRNLVLGSASLWTHITLNAPQWWVETLLDRSQKAPLVVEIDLEKPFVKNLSPVWVHFSRIRRLSILATARPCYVASRSDNLPSVWTFLPEVPVVADILESLTLRLSHNAAISACLPRTIFAAGAPRLRQLELQNCDFDINTPFLTGITSFSLAFKPEGLSRQEIIDTLHSMPNLEILYLEDSVHSVGSATHASTYHGECMPVLKPTSLRRLVQLTIINVRVTDCFYILNNFTFPILSTTKLILGGMYDTSELEHLTALVSRLINGGGLGIRRPFHHLVAWCSFSERVEIEAWDVKPADPLRESPPLCLWVSLPNHKPAHICSSIVRALPLDDLQNLTTYDFGIIDWSMFGPLKSLRYLSASNFFSDAGLTEALDAEIPPGPQLFVEKAQPPLLYFPSLRELKIQGWTFDKDRDILLGSALMKRRKSCIPINKLLLVQCDMSVGQEERLRTIVDTVLVK